MIRGAACSNCLYVMTGMTPQMFHELHHDPSTAAVPLLTAHGISQLSCRNATQLHNRGVSKFSAEGC